MLRFGSIGGRAHAFFGDDRKPNAVDIERTLGLPADPMQCIGHWDELRSRLDELANSAARQVDLTELDCPVPQPSQLFAVGLNYRKHAEEMNSQAPSQPLVFAKFPSSLNSPTGTVTIVGDTCDYESGDVAPRFTDRNVAATFGDDHHHFGFVVASVADDRHGASR